MSARPSPPPTPPASGASSSRRRHIVLVALVGLVSLLLLPLVGTRTIRALPRRPSAASAVRPTALTRIRSTGRPLFVAADARPGAPGSIGQPLTLADALAAGGPARPGDVIWLRGGVYPGPFNSEVRGTPEVPVVVAAYPGERVVLDGGGTADGVVLRVDGAHTVIWGLEITNSAPPVAGQARGTGVDVFGPGTRLVNLVVHATGNGIGVWTPAIGAEVYGCLIYSVGWEADDRGHGHSIYIQNDVDTKRVVDNVMFDSHSYGIHAFTSLGQINNLYFEGNIAFDHGTPSAVSGAKANFLVGGRPIAHAPVLVSNYAYYPAASAGRDADVGYISGCVDAVIRDNYLAGGTPLVLTRCTNVQMSGNRFVGRVDPATAARYPANDYLETPPTEPVVFVRPNRYERGRGAIAVFNWGRQPHVRIDLSTLGLRRGERFEIRNARDFFGAPVVVGTNAAAPLDLPLAAGEAGLPGEAPEFAAFLVVPEPRGLPSGAPGVHAADRPTPADGPDESGISALREGRRHE